MCLYAPNPYCLFCFCLDCVWQLQPQPLALPPRVLFGTRTSQQEALSNPHISLRSQAAKQGTAVLHATVEAADACSPLRVARTIFFSQGAGAAEMPLQLRINALQQQQQQDVAMGGCNSPQPAAAGEAGANGNCSGAGMARCDSGATNNSAGGGCCAKQQQQYQQEQPQQQVLQQLPVNQALSGGDFEPDQTDLFDLMCWYWAAVDAAWQCMEYYATHVSVAGGHAELGHAAAGQQPDPFESAFRVSMGCARIAQCSYSCRLCALQSVVTSAQAPAGCLATCVLTFVSAALLRVGATGGRHLAVSTGICDASLLECSRGSTACASAAATAAVSATPAEACA